MNDFEALKLSLAGRYDGFDARVRELPHPWKATKIRATGRFFYLAFRGSNPTIDDFITFVYSKIIPFCVPRTERKRLLNLLAESQDEKFAQELCDKAKNLFVKAIKSQQTSGEPGEVILFILLEAVFKAPQIACKMYLKTSENVPVHGSDSVHMYFDESRSRMLIFWGESKLRKKLSDALDDVVESIKNFIGSEHDRAPRERDIDIIRDHTNVDDPIQRAALISYFNPYKEESNNRIEIFACLAGFEFSACTECIQQSPDEAEDWFNSRYKSRIESACKLFEEKAHAAGLNHLEFSFVLLPFADIEELRKGFFKKLGIQ